MAKGIPATRQFGLSNGNAKANERMVRAIRRNRQGWTARTQAQVYRLGIMTVYRIRWGETYPDVK